MKTEKSNYEEPIVKVLEVTVEKGFATSQTGGKKSQLHGWIDGGSF